MLNTRIFKLSQPSRAAVSSSGSAISNPPSPQAAITGRWGLPMLAPIAAGSAKPIDPKWQDAIDCGIGARGEVRHPDLCEPESFTTMACSNASDAHAITSRAEMRSADVP